MQKFYDRALDWLFQQGVSTVLLGFLCFAAYCAAPRVEALFERQRKDFIEAQKSQGELFERTLDRMQGATVRRKIDPSPAVGGS